MLCLNGFNLKGFTILLFGQCFTIAWWDKVTPCTNKSPCVISGLVMTSSVSHLRRTADIRT